jgi:hypothetical protein
MKRILLTQMALTPEGSCGASQESNNPESTNTDGTGFRSGKEASSLKTTSEGSEQPGPGTANNQGEPLFYPLIPIHSSFFTLINTNSKSSSLSLGQKNCGVTTNLASFPGNNPSPVISTFLVLS